MILTDCLVAGRNGTLRRAATHSPIAAARFGPHPLVYGMLYIFVFSLLFEMGEDRLLPFELPTLLGCFFIMAAILQPILCFGRVPAPLWCFAIYAFIFVMSHLVNGGEMSTIFFKRLFWLGQLLLIFWAAYNLFRYRAVAEGALSVFAVASGIVATLYLSGLATTLAGDRTSAMGQNPSHMAGLLALGFIAAVGLLYSRRPPVLTPRFLAWPVFAALGLSIVSSGGRAALLGLGAGLVMFLFQRTKSTGEILRNVFVSLAILGFLALAASQSESMNERLESAFETGSMAGRETIYPVAWQMFLERPVLGWGPVDRDYEIQRRIRRQGVDSIDPHNMLLDLLTATGLLGTIPFLAGLCLCLHCCWRASRGAHGMLPAALVVTSLIINMSMNWLSCKAFWLVLAYAAANPISVESRKVKQWR